MPETLVIRLPDDAANAAQFVLVDQHGTPVSEVAQSGLEAAAELSEGRRVIGLAPASQVLRTRANVPLKNKAKIQQALPFALEEQLAGDVDAQHFAFAARDADGEIPVAVVAAERLEAWLETLSAAGIRPDALFAESDAIATVPATVTVLVDGERIVVRDADGRVTTADPDSLQAILELILEAQAARPPAASDAGKEVDSVSEQETEPEELDAVPVNVLVYCSEADHERFAVYWDMLRLRVDNLDIHILAGGALPRLASQISNSAGVNLLQGAYAPQRKLPVQWQQWQIPAALLGGCVVIALLLSAIELWQLSSEERALDAAAADLLQTTFSGTGEVSDPWAELRSRLGDSGADAAVAAGPGFAAALEALSAAYSKTGDISLQALSYRDGNVDIQLVAPNVERLDQLRQGITESGLFSAEIQSANPDGDTVRGRMKIYPQEAD